jgi:hypothetical protein
MALVYDRELNGDDTTWSVSISHVAYLRKLFNFFDAERVVRRAARADLCAHSLGQGQLHAQDLHRVLAGIGINLTLEKCSEVINKWGDDGAISFAVGARRAERGRVGRVSDAGSELHGILRHHVQEAVGGGEGPRLVQLPRLQGLGLG